MPTVLQHVGGTQQQWNGDSGACTLLLIEADGLWVWKECVWYKSRRWGISAEQQCSFSRWHDFTVPWASIWLTCYSAGVVLIISFRQVFQVLYGGRMSHIYFTYCVQGSLLGPSLFILVQSTRAQSALEAFRCYCVLANVVLAVTLLLRPR